MSNIKVIRLTSSEQVICELLEQTDSVVKIKFGYVINVDGETNRLMFNPLAPFSTATGEIDLTTNSVSFISDAGYWLVDQYNDLVDGKLPQE
jgi:hypothetical protein